MIQETQCKAKMQSEFFFITYEGAYPMVFKKLWHTFFAPNSLLKKNQNHLTIAIGKLQTSRSGKNNNAPAEGLFVAYTTTLI